MTIALSCPCFQGNESKYVNECLNSEWISSSGVYASRFEEAFARYVGTPEAAATVNGTAALHICLVLAGVGPGDEVVVPTLTFIAPVNTVRYVGAEPVFMDCDQYLNMDVKKLRRFFEDECSFEDKVLVNRSSGKRIKAVIPVHIFGSLCEMEEIVELADRYHIRVIEDATEALGSRMTKGRFKGRHGGALGDFGCYSFNGNKIITTGGGGMIVAHDPDVIRHARYLTTQAKDDGLRYVHNEVGYNYRLPALLSSLGLAQLEQLPAFIAAKKSRYQQYRKEIAAIPGLRLLDIPDYCDSNCWYYSLVVDEQVYGRSSDELLNKFQEEGIQTRPLWGLNHRQQPYHTNQAYCIERADWFVDHVLNIPCSVGLTEEELHDVVNHLKKWRG